MSTEKQDIIQLVPGDLMTVPECDRALFMLDEAIAKIEAQLAHGRLGGDRDWEYRAKLSFGLIKAKREAINRRREALVNKLPDFMEALERKFGAQQVQEVWNDSTSH